MKVRGGQGKWLMRQLLEQYIPKEFFDRPKQGFNIPLSDWLNNDLKDWAEDLLNKQDLQANGFKADSVQTAWQDHKNGSTRNSDKLWAVCQYQLWARKWL